MNSDKYMNFSVIHLLACLLFLASVSACSGSAYQRAEKLDTLEAWRVFLADPGSEEDEVNLAQSRLDTLAWKRAKKVRSIEGYKRYLEEVPRAAHRVEAEDAMAELRFDRLGPEAGRAELEDYLRRHPEGSHSSEVKARLVEHRRKQALGATEDPIPGLERWLADHASADGAEAVVAELDRLRFEAARAAGTTLALQSYLARFPRGLHREAAEIGLAERALRAARFEGLEASARKILASAPVSGREQLAQADAEARLHRALRRLDREALDGLLRESAEEASTIPEATASAVLAALKALGKGKAARALTNDALLLDAPDPGISWAALERALEAPDARRRRVGARALGFTGSTRAVPLLINLLEDRDLRVAHTAGVALRRLAGSLDPLVRDVIFTERLHAIEPRAASPARQATVAIVREAAGAGGVLPRLRAAAEGGSRLAGLRLLGLSKNSRGKLVALGRLATALRERTTARLSRLEESLRGAAVEPADLRAGRSALWLGERLLATHRALTPKEQPADESPKWVADLQLQGARLETLLPRAEGRYRLAHPEFLSGDLDEGEARRQKAARASVEAVRRLKAAGEVSRLALASAARSPHSEVRAVVEEATP